MTIFKLSQKRKLLHSNQCVTALIFRNIYRVERRKRKSVKKITLSERSELGIFNEKTTEAKVVGSLPTSQPFRELLCLLFLRRKKVREKSIKARKRTKLFEFPI